MSKRIYVQAQTDHIEGLSKGSPLAAVEELVWNALDAGAKEVQIDVITNELSGIDAIRVRDDGSGIDAINADKTFGSLGGSWKRGFTEPGPWGRRLHGRHGRGRFKAFVLGCHVEWRTTMRAGEGLMSYILSGDISEPGVFTIEDQATGPATGTEVFITNVRANSVSLLNAAETVQNLASKFALYLKSYPDVRIYFNGLPVTPIIVQKEVTDYTIHIESGAEAKLEVIEWKRKFVGTGKLVFAGDDGFQLHEQSAGVRANGASFTAYLISPRFVALNQENALVMDELNPEVRMYLDEARKILKAHFLAWGEKKLDEFTDTWRNRLSDLSDKERKIIYEMLCSWK